MNKIKLLIIAVVAHVSLLEAAPKSCKKLQQKQNAAAQALAQNKRAPSEPRVQTLKHTVANITLHKCTTEQGRKNILLWEIYTVRPIETGSNTEKAGNTAQAVIVTRSLGETPEYTALYHGVPADVWAKTLYADIQRCWKLRKNLDYDPLTPAQKEYLITQK